MHFSMHFSMDFSMYFSIDFSMHFPMDSGSNRHPNNKNIHAKKTRKKEENKEKRRKKGEKKRTKKKEDFFLKTRTRLPLKSDARGLKNVFPPTRRVIVSLYARSLREWKSDLRCPGFLSRNFCTPYLAILNFAQFFRISHSFLIAFSCFSRFFASVFGFSHSFLIAFWSKNRKNFLALRASQNEKAMKIKAF